MQRRTFLRTVGAGALVGAGGAGTAAANGDSEAEQNPTPADGSEVYVPKVNEIRSPLAGVPTIRTPDDRLRVELDAGAEIPLETVAARLEPSFGGPVQVDLRRVATDADPDGSRIWNADAEADGAEAAYEDVVVAEFAIPSFDDSDAFTPDLYDLVVTWDGGMDPSDGTDRQPRAVSVRREVPDELDVAVIADPQIGDPRGMQSGFEESAGKREPGPFLRRAQGITGNGPNERWAATKRAIAEVNALDPDLVLVAGDLCLGQDAPGKFYAEYEDAWDVMNQVRAPTFVTCGNHDAYVQSGTDGKALYRETFGPPSYSVPVGDVAQVVAVDTYDWSYLDRLGASVAVSTYGGQVRDAQFEWLREELAEVAGDDQDRSILAFGHHNPSWVPDPKNRAYDDTDGRPVAEQFARGSRIAESGQGWTGENAFALRRLFDGTGVDAFFCGHSHKDRVARSMADWEDAADDAYVDVDGDGDTEVYTAGDPPDVVAALGSHYAEQSYASTGGDTTGRVENYPDPEIRRVDSNEEGEDDMVQRIQNTAKGTLYVNVASTMSSTSEYWGWRQFDYDTTAEGLDPRRFRYPMSDGFLRRRAVDPDRWDHEQAEVGLFSTPSYLLDVTDEGNANAPDGRRITVTNDQEVVRFGAVTVSTTVTDPRVEGGTVVWERDAGPRTDLKIAYEVLSGGETTITVTDEGSERGRR